MIEIKEIHSAEEKSRICNEILRALPEWFGIEAAIVSYTEQVQSLPFYAVFDGDKAVGFVAIKVHTAAAAELCVMGVLEAYHRQGLGKKLMACCESYCKENNISFLTVKTLDASCESESYARTRAFYSSVGFLPLEAFPLHWDAENPCLFMAKYIAV